MPINGPSPTRTLKGVIGHLIYVQAISAAVIETNFCANSFVNIPEGSFRISAFNVISEALLIII